MRHRPARPSETAPPVVLIAGASSGIGLQTALCYAERGARLVLAARSLGALQDAEEQCLQAGAAATLVVVTDVVEPARVDTMLEEAVARFGQIDIAVGCVGVAAFGRFEDVPADVFEAVVRANVIGTANLARSVLAHFRIRRLGTLVIVGSVLGQVAVPYLSAYVVSKFAVTALARVLRQETRDLPGVRIHEIRPGGVNTPIYVRAANYAGRVGRPPPPVDDPATIAAAILRSVDDGREDVSVGLANPVLLLGFRLFPAVFDVVVGPLMRVTGLSRQRIDPHPGAVLEPRPGTCPRPLAQPALSPRPSPVVVDDNAAMSKPRRRVVAPLEPAWAAGTVARRLGIPPSTLRAWNRRYGIGPADHQAGRHRHYTEHDIAALETMCQLIGQGVLPAAAAATATARRTPEPEAAEPTWGPAAAPHRRAVRGLVAAALRLDVESALQNLATNLETHGVVTTWNQLCRPALTSIGRRIDETGSCMDVELLMAWAITTSLHRVVRRSPIEGRTRRVLLACAEGEHHDLPLEALHAALIQHGVTVRMFGPSVPTDALEDAIRRTAPAAVVLFAQLPRTARPTVLRRIDAITDSTIAAGNGWSQNTLPAEVSLATSIEHALELIQTAVRPPASIRRQGA